MARAPMEPPPSRYRVVERGRRLEVIDTRGGSTRGSGRPVAEPRRGRSNNDRRTDLGAGMGTPTGPFAAVFHAIARAASLGAQDDAGRPLFTTAAWFDSRAPRTFALDRAAERRLASGLLAAAGLSLLVVMLAGPFGLAFPVIAVAVVSQQGRHLLARWFDRFPRAD